MAGTRFTKDQIDDTLGTALTDVNVALTKVEALRDFLQTKTDPDLTNLGYSAAEIALLRAAFDDMDQLWKIYRGGALPAAPKDFRDNAKKLWGMGI